MQDNEFMAAGMRAHTSVDGRCVRLDFYDEQEREIPIVIRRESVPSLLHELQSRIGEGSVRSISRHGMPVGMVFRLTGVQTAPRPGGGARLTLHLTVEDGVRTLPIDLPPDELKDFISDLSKHF